MYRSVVQVSMMSKLVPSPDWFVGVDSIDLCSNGRFLDSVTVESDPFDAGTDNGFTFTSPNWPTTPPGVIFRITNVYPTHPAGSFHYPDLPELPTIAAFTFVKEKEFKLHEVYHFDKFAYESLNNVKAEPSQEIAFVPKTSAYDSKDFQMTEPSSNDDDDDDVDFMSNDIMTTIANEKKKLSTTTTAKSTTTLRSSSSSTTTKRQHHRNALKSPVKSFRRSSKGYHSSTGPKDFFKKKYKSQILEVRC